MCALACLQVLGGAGPAIAAVPLTVVWAGGSVVTLATGLGAGRVGPVGAVQRVGFVFFMSIAQARTAYFKLSKYCIEGPTPFTVEVSSSIQVYAVDAPFHQPDSCHVYGAGNPCSLCTRH